MMHTAEGRIKDLERGDKFTLFGLDIWRTIAVLVSTGDFVRLVAIQEGPTRGHLVVKVDKNLPVTLILAEA